MHITDLKKCDTKIENPKIQKIKNLNEINKIFR